METEKTNQGLDPELASLLGLDSTPAPSPQASSNNATIEATDDTAGVDEEAETPVSEDFGVVASNSDYVKQVFEGVPDDVAQTVFQVKGLFENPPNPQDRFTYKERLTTNYWNAYRYIASRLIDRADTAIQRLAVRYNIIDDSYLTPELLDIFKKVPMKGEGGPDIYFLDEWFMSIGFGKISVSLTDEIQFSKKSSSDKTRDRLEKKQGQKDTEILSLRSKIEQLLELEDQLKTAVEILTSHETYDEVPLSDDFEFIHPYDQPQREAISSIAEILRKLTVINREIKDGYRALERFDNEIGILENQAGPMDDDNGDGPVGNKEDVVAEYNSIRQMIKMCVGPRGNHFPILLTSYFMNPTELALRDNLQKILKELEELDAGVFIRTYKGEDHRIVPYFVLLPCYGDRGICWEPFPKGNRATGRGRVAIPMYSKSLKKAVIAGLADLRWQVAKEKAQHYWMEEGLTGYYYEYYTNQKFKGDIKNYFIKDYTLWLTMESQGMQKLHRDIRPVFWRYTPFPQELKENLKNRGFFYAELYKKDQNRAMSDGY